MPVPFDPSTGDLERPLVTRAPSRVDSRSRRRSRERRDSRERAEGESAGERGGEGGGRGSDGAGRSEEGLVVIELIDFVRYELVYVGIWCRKVMNILLPRV